MMTIFLKEYLVGLVSFYLVAILVGKFFSLGAWRAIHNFAYSSPLMRGEVFNRSSFSRTGPVNGGTSSAGFGWLVVIISLICIAIFIPMEMTK